MVRSATTAGWSSSVSKALTAGPGRAAVSARASSVSGVGSCRYRRAKRTTTSSKASSSDGTACRRPVVPQGAANAVEHQRGEGRRVPVRQVGFENIGEGQEELGLGTTPDEGHDAVGMEAWAPTGDAEGAGPEREVTGERSIGITDVREGPEDLCGGGGTGDREELVGEVSTLLRGRPAQGIDEDFVTNSFRERSERVETRLERKHG